MPLEFKDTIKELEAAQETEQENRKAAKEADAFLNIRGGQWEDAVVDEWGNKPRYTFDECNPVIDGIMADLSETDFAVGVLPKGMGSTKKMAEKYAGIIRSIEDISSAKFIYKAAAKKMASTGIAGWRIKQDWRDSDAFDQDLLIDSISNFRQRVWFDQGAVKPTMEDADYCWILTDMYKADYDRDFPKGSGLSVGNAEYDELLQVKKESVRVGEYLYKVETDRTLLLLSNNQVIVKDADFDKVRDEMFGRNITVIDERVRKLYTVHQKFFDGRDWLTDSAETVFEYLPVIPLYANFDVFEDKIIYWGAIEKLMDPQRILNYAESKKIAESALKPFEKVWMTTEQAKGQSVKRSLQSQNKNTDPVQLYKHVDGHPAPYKPQPNQVDTVLVESAKSAQSYIDRAANMYDAQRGIGLSGQAKETVELLQHKGSSSNFKYIDPMELALTHTARILGNAIPKVYGKQQQLRILHEDGSDELFVAGEEHYDEETRETVILNDLSKGSYSFSYKSGPAYYTRQQEAVSNILEAGRIDPSIIEMGSDVLLNNMPGVGIDQIAARKRKQLFEAGLLTKEQLTKEELQKVEDSKNEPPPPPTPTEQANLKIAEAEEKTAVAKLQDTLSKMQERQDKSQLQMQQMMLDAQLKQQKLQDDKEAKILDVMMQQSAQLKTQAETLKLLKEAIGADKIINNKAIRAYDEQAEIVVDTQQELQ